MALALTEAANSSQELEISRPLAKFSPSVWGDHFISFSTDHNSKWEVYSEEIKVLKEEVREMLTASTSNNYTVEKMNLINLLERLGVSYHFESEIEEQLQHIFDAFPANFDDDNLYDLCTLSLQFRIFRQHGYNISSDVFKKFKDSNGKFKETLTRDVKGMLSLYEATQLRIHGEDILDEALAFSTAHLESSMAKKEISPPQLAKQVIHALNLPYHKGMPRIETRHFISIYQEDESRNESLLKFAQLDFNLLQSLHQQELSHISKWWKDLDLALTLSYARDRVVELYFWMSGAYLEPQYSLARLIATKLSVFVSILDDTYDAYGTLEELQVFTDAIQRWEAGAVDQLPDYMKVIYRALLNLYNELEEEMAKKGRSYSIHHNKEVLKELVRSYYVEAKWHYEGYVPTFDEYMEIALITGSTQILAAISFLGMEEIVTEKAYDWLQTKPKMITAGNIIIRLVDDIKSHKAEQERGHVASSVECYMKQYNLSEEEITEGFLKRISDAWKDMNEEYLRPTPVSMHLLMRVVNLSRVVEVIYQHGDGYTNAEFFLKDYITSLFIDPIPVQE